MVKHLRAATSICIAAAVVGVSAGTASARQRSRAHSPLGRRGPAGQRKRARHPLGMPGHWRIVFDDEFNGHHLNQTRWNAHIGWTNQNHVTDSLRNLTVRGGHAIFRLASTSSGAEIETNTFGLAVGEYAQARIKFAGYGGTVYNWPAWWISGPSWPAAGENDIAEGLGSLTVNYHSPTGAHNKGTVNGDWTQGFHIYGIYRGRFVSRVYWDGQLVRTYPTDDNGQPENLWLTIGAANIIRTGAAGEMVVDYVRAWSPV